MDRCNAQSHHEAFARATLSSIALAGYCRPQAEQYMGIFVAPSLPFTGGEAPFPWLFEFNFEGAVDVSVALPTMSSVLARAAVLPPFPREAFPSLPLPLPRFAVRLSDKPSPSCANCAARTSSGFGGGLAPRTTTEKKFWVETLMIPEWKGVGFGHL